MKEPKYSCPYLDEVIRAAKEAVKTIESEAEVARGIHVDLRDWGHEWKDKAEDFEVKLDEVTSERDELDRENTTLLNRIEELERSLAQAEAELAERVST
jgi:chromosome segregation ATPase